MHDLRRNSNGETLPPRKKDAPDYDDKLAGKAWPAQPDNLAVTGARNMLISSAAMLLYQAYRLTKTQKPKARQEMRRQLSGVLGTVETVRMSIKE